MSLQVPQTGRTRERYARLGHGLRMTWAFCVALVAVIGGVSTLNMVSANRGMATLNEITSPFIQYFSRKA